MGAGGGMGIWIGHRGCANWPQNPLHGMEEFLLHAGAAGLLRLGAGQLPYQLEAGEEMVHRRGGDPFLQM